MDRIVRPVLADAAPKGDLLLGLGILFTAAMLGFGVGMAFLLRWLHRHAKTWWRVPSIVGTWILLLGCVLALFQLGYALVTGGELPQ